MFTRKELKQKGKQTLKKHYLVFVAVCLISAFLASEFKGSLSFASLQYPEQLQESFQLHASALETSKRGIVWQDVYQDILQEYLDQGKIFSAPYNTDSLSQFIQENPLSGPAVSLASNMINQFSSGSVVVLLAASVNTLAQAESAGIILLILGAAGAMILFWLLIQNTYGVILRRIFLEGHTYQRVPISRFLFLFRIRKWLKASWIMLVKYVFQLLWSLTVIGGFVKHYSYFLVPYIIAENPDMTAGQAITLSRKLMDGHKWECFLFELSFLGWDLLGLLTLGISSLFFSNPYKTAAFTEYYVCLRKAAKAGEIPNAELLNDLYLYEKADGLTLMERYLDILDIMENPAPKEPELPGIRGFLSRNFGLLLFWGRQERAYEELQAGHIRDRELSHAVKGLVYPSRLYPIPEEKKRRQIESLHYMRQYNIWTLLAFFFAISIFGWLWEVSLHLISTGDLINHGFLNGPWLPMYGCAALLILTLLYRLRKNPFTEAFCAVLLCGVMEYAASLVIEANTGGIAWWNYSGYILNIHGRICADELIVFGVGGMAVVYILAPLADNFLREINPKLFRIFLLILLVLFCMDIIYSWISPNMWGSIHGRFFSPAEFLQKLTLK